MLVDKHRSVKMKILYEYTKGDGKLLYVEIETDGKIKILSAEHFRERYAPEVQKLPTESEMIENVNVPLSHEKKRAG